MQTQQAVATLDLLQNTAILTSSPHSPFMEILGWTALLIMTAFSLLILHDARQRDLADPFDNPEELPK